MMRGAGEGGIQHQPVYHRPAPPRVLIVGGGLAGLAAAVGLVGRGLELAILESRPRLGGRASSFRDAATGELVDNAQHVSMGCCTNLADFSERVGVRDLFLRQREVVYFAPDGRRATLRGSGLPAPLHLAPSFLRFGLFSPGDQWRLGRALWALRKPISGSDSETFLDWLKRHGQTDRLIAWFWEPLLVSALNERLDRMDRAYARKVIVDGLMRNGEGYVVEIPKVPLGELYGTRLKGWLEERGVKVELGTGVREVVLDGDGSACGVRLRDGRVQGADLVIFAVPWDRLRDMVPEPARESWKELARLEEVTSAPITGIHMWLDRPVCPVVFGVTLGRTIQWVFNHTLIRREGGRIHGPDEESAGEYLQMVVSAAYDLEHRSLAEIKDLAVMDLRSLWPNAMGQAQVLRWKVVTEHGATFGVRPGIDALRLPQRTPIDNLFLAGDWTLTGWPATMEGAVRSGYRAAEEVLQVLNRPSRLVRDDLPESWLARGILGPSERRND
jgi:squalene-associated FAD-dependent desaturase